MRQLVSLSIIASMVFILFIVPGCQQKPKEEAKPTEVTEPAKEMKESAEGVMEEGKEAVGEAVEAGKEAAGEAMEAGKEAAGEAVEAGKEAAGEMMEKGKEMMEKPAGEATEKMK